MILGLLVVVVAAAALISMLRSPLPRPWVEVRPGWLFRSAQIPSVDVQAVLREQRIDLVVDLTNDPPGPRREAEAAAARALGASYLHAEVSATTALEGYALAVAAIAQAHERGERVLVHCEFGHRRSAAAVALFARLVEHEPPEVAYRELYRFADARAAWQAELQSFLEAHLADLEARVTAERAISRSHLTTSVSR